MNFLRGTEEEWRRINPILEDGQPGYERMIVKDDQGNIIQGSNYFKLKIGDGITRWNDLPYISEGNNTSIEFDSEPTLGSNNAVTSNGIFLSLQSLRSHTDECYEETNRKLNEIKDLLDKDGFQNFLNNCADELNKKGYYVSEPTKEEIYNAVLSVAYAPVIEIMISEEINLSYPKYSDNFSSNCINISDYFIDDDYTNESLSNTFDDNINNSSIIDIPNEE